MNMRYLTVVAITLVLGLFFSSPASAQSTHFDIEVGYQWVDVNGNEDMYRTQINQEEGFVLRDFSLNYTDPTGNAKFADNFRIDAAGFGGNPAGRFRFWMGLKKLYRLRLFYNQFENFSAMPAFANPLLDSGVTPGQHTWNRDRKILDFELELLPNRTVTPIVGYRRNTVDGPRNTTYSVGQDEFQLTSDLEETEQEFYAGLTFQTTRFWGTFIQGWRDYEGVENLSLLPGANGGNNDQPVLGTDVTMDEFSRSVRTTADTPVTTANVQGKLGESIGLEVSYVQSDLEGQTQGTEMLTGSFVSYSISRFFQGLDQTIESRTDNPYWRGEGRLTFDLSQKVRFDVGYEKRHRDLEGWALISSLYLDTLNFSGYDPRDVEVLIEAEDGYDRDDEIISGRLNLKDIGPFVLWVEAARRDTDLSVSQDVSQIVVPGGQEGSWERNVDVFGAGAALTLGGATVSLDIGTESSDEVIVRTDFTAMSRMRGRLDWKIVRWLRLVTTAELIQRDNSSAEVGYTAETDHIAVNLDFNPLETLTFRLAYDSYDTDTRIGIRIPQTFQIVPSIYNDNGTLYEGGLQWQPGIFNFDIGYSSFDNCGSFEFDTTRAFARAGVAFSNSWSAAVEYESYDYSEQVLTLADFDAARYGVYLRWRR